MDPKKYMKHALELAKIALSEDEVPVGCVIVKEGKIIGEGYDRRESTCDPSAHAEILALRQAGEETGHWNLENAQCFVTLEPCPMCAGALLLARISHLYFGTENPKWGAVISHAHLLDTTPYPHTVPFTSGILKEETSYLLSQFFQKKRKLG